MLEVVFLSSDFWIGSSRNLNPPTFTTQPCSSYYASAIGIFFSAIYLRTGILWWTIVLHFLVIFTSFLLSQATQAAPATSIWYFILWLLLITIVLCLIRPKKLEAIRRLSNWHFIQHSISTPIRPDFIKISYQVFIYSYQDFTDIRLLILL